MEGERATLGFKPEVFVSLTLLDAMYSGTTKDSEPYRSFYPLNLFESFAAVPSPFLKSRFSPRLDGWREMSLAIRGPDGFYSLLPSALALVPF